MWYEFNRQHIDLIMLDINLPGVDGLSLTRELQSSHVGIILVSGRMNLSTKSLVSKWAPMIM